MILVLLALIALTIPTARSRPSDVHSNSSSLDQFCETYDVCAYGQLCLNETCSPCELSVQCEEQVHSTWRCFFPDGANESGRCEHKNLWPLDWRDYLSFSLNFFFSALSAASGVGGSSFFVPTFILLHGFDSKHSIALGSILVVGASIANFLQMAPRRNPHHGGPLILYELALLMQPAILMGTTIGQILNAVFPAWLIVLLFCCVLFYTAYKSGKKGIMLFREEQEARARDKDTELAVVESGTESEKKNESSEGTYLLSRPLNPSNGLSNASIESELQSQLLSSMAVPSPSMRDRIVAWLIDDSVQYPWGYILLTILACVTILLPKFLLDVAMQSGSISLCSPSYWLIYIGPPITIAALYTLCLVAFIRWKSRKQQILNMHEAVAIEKQDALADKIITLPNPNRVPAYSLDGPRGLGYVVLFSAMAGVSASLVGLGGVLTIALILDMGILPDVCSATNTYMILWTAGANSIQFAQRGLLHTDYGVVLLIIGFLSSICGQTLISYLVQKYNRLSLIVLGLMLVVIFSGVLLLYVGGRNMIHSFQSGHIGFSSYCH